MKPATLLCHRFDGVIDWEKVDRISLVDTVTGNATRQATFVQAAWTKTHLGVRFTIEDDEINAVLTHRDAPLYTEEVVEVFFDPWGDGNAYYEIEVNPLNAVCDLLLRRSRSGYLKNFEWDCADLKTRAERTSTGWVAELAIPFLSVVDKAPSPGDTWRGNFYRIDRPSNGPWELSAWSPTLRPHFHVQNRFGRIELCE